MAINGGLSAWWFHLAAVVTTHEFTNSQENRNGDARGGATRTDTDGHGRTRKSTTDTPDTTNTQEPPPHATDKKRTETATAKHTAHGRQGQRTTNRRV